MKSSILLLIALIGLTVALPTKMEPRNEELPETKDGEEPVSINYIP